VFSRASRIREVAEARGAQVLRLAPYSPDFNPIEQCWPKIKTFLHGVKARTAEAHDEDLVQAIGFVTKSDIRGWFKHCGYSLAHERNTLWKQLKTFSLEGYRSARFL